MSVCTRLLFVFCFILVNAINANATTTYNGTLSGEFAVTPSGAASYSIPVEVPPGINGLQPNLALTYNSQAGNGLLGVGWQLSGLSAITRCSQTIAQDGKKGGINFDAEDRFCLNGARLIAVNGADGGHGTEYRTEVESFSKVISYGGTVSNGPNYFKVWAKDGSIYEYGNTPDSLRNVKDVVTGVDKKHSWAVNNISDRYTNAITFLYVEDIALGTHYIDSIVYGDNLSVIFNYENRTDTVADKALGVKKTPPVRLSSIHTELLESTIRTYSLSYEYAASGGVSRVVSISHCIDSNCQLSSNFIWSDGTYEFSNGGAWASGVYANWRVSPNRIHQMDVNGDGLQDMVMGPDNQGRWFVLRSDGTQFIDDGPWISGAYANWRESADRIHQMDVNGDGLQDIVMGPDNQGRWFVLRSEGDRFVDDGTWISGAYANWRESPNRIRQMDVNGDGLQDMVIGPAGNGSWFVLRSEGDRFVDDGAWISGAYGGWDGAASRIRPMDVNGDGLQDLVIGPAGNGDWNVLRSEGDHFVDDGAWISGAYGNWDESADRIRPMDVNGDGLQDIVVGPDSSGRWFVLKPGEQKENMLINISRGGVVEVEINYTPITDKSIYTKYSNMDSPNRGDYSLQEYQAPISVVSSYKTNNGIGGENTYSYHYEGAKLNLHGRGFLGFAKITKTDQQTNIKTDSYYHQQTNVSDFWKTGLLEKSESFVNGKLIARITNEWLSASSDRGHIFPYVSQSIASTFEPTNNSAKITEKTITNSAVDMYGNVGSVSTTTLDGSTSLQTNTYKPADVSNWIIDRVSRSHISATPSSLVSGGMVTTHYDISDFTYYPSSGALWTKISHVGSDVELKETFTYNGYGNRLSHKAEGKDGTQMGSITTRTSNTSYSYSATQLTVVKTNPLLQSETQVIDRATGQLVSQTGPNNLTTTWKYDDFARKTRENRADDTFTTWKYLNCDAGQYCAAGDQFYMKRTTAGKPQYFEHYDSLGRITATHTQGTDSGFIHKYKVYDNIGRVIKESRNEFDGVVTNWTQYFYDELGRPSKVLLPGNNDINNPDEVYSYQGYIPGYGIKKLTTQYRKGSNGHSVLINTQYKDSSDRLLRSVDALGNDNRYAYDGFGRLIEVIDPLLNRVSYGYNKRGDKTSVNDPNLGVWNYRYDALGLLREQRDAKDQLTTMNYDILNRLKTRHEATGGQSVWVYDSAAGAGKGKLHSLSRSSDNYQEVYSYDSYGRAAGMTTKLDGVNYVVTNQYDVYSRLKYVTYPASGSKGRFKKKNTYSSSGYLMSVSDNSTGYGFWTRISTNADSNVSWEVLGNGLSTMRGFDPLTRRLQAITTGFNSQVQNLAYSFDSIGNLESRTDNNQKWLGLSGVTENFYYDTLNRLTSSTINSSVAKVYQYDAVGNISYSSDLGTYSYGAGSAGPHAVTYVQGASLSYDANGNMTSGRSRTLNYTSFNKPAFISKGASSTAFSYGPNRNMYKQIAVTSGSTTTSRYVGKLFEQVNKPDGSVEYRNNIFAGGKLIATHTRKSNAATTLRFLHTDHLGSISAITKENGQVLERFSYDPFGKRRDAEWNDGFMASMSSLITGMGFTKHKQLDNIGLVHMGGRVYDPELARFTSADPKVAYPGSTQGWNRYSYTDNNPLSRVDPTGYGWLSKNKEKIKMAVKVVVAAAIIYMTAGMAASVMKVTMLAGEIIGGLTGAYSAHKAGGDVASGFLFGVAVGAAAGAVAGGATNYITQASLSKFTEFVAVGATQGSLFGASNGASIGYAGGKGSMSEIGKSAWQGLKVGAVTGAVLGGLNYVARVTPFGIGQNVIVQDVFSPIMKTSFGHAIIVGASVSYVQLNMDTVLDTIKSGVDFSVEW